MKNETKLHRMIRKIVKEELDKQHHDHEPHPFAESEERPPWTLFDEHPAHEESVHRHFESSRHQDLSTDPFTDLSDPLHNETLTFQRIEPKKRRRKRRR